MRYDVIVFKDYNGQVKLAAMPREAKTRETKKEKSCKP